MVYDFPCYVVNIIKMNVNGEIIIHTTRSRICVRRLQLKCVYATRYRYKSRNGVPKKSNNSNLKVVVLKHYRGRCGC